VSSVRCPVFISTKLVTSHKMYSNTVPWTVIIFTGILSIPVCLKLLLTFSLEESFLQYLSVCPPIYSCWFSVHLRTVNHWC
jgi:hypothetical protein